MLGVPFGTRRTGYALRGRTACGILAVLMLVVSGCQSLTRNAVSQVEHSTRMIPAAPPRVGRIGPNEYVLRAQSPPEFVARPNEDSPAAESVGDLLSKIVIEGNTTIPSLAILEKIKSQAGRSADQKQIKEDLRTLYATRWFFSVEPRYRQSDDGMVLVFRVVERPMVVNVEYQGNKKIKTKILAGLTGLELGSPFDVSANRESVRRIEQHYRQKGFPNAKVMLLKGSEKDDREVIFQIDEGKKIIVNRIIFEGNESQGSSTLRGLLGFDSFSPNVLRSKLRTKRALFGLTFLRGKFDPAAIPDDIAGLTRHYQNLGFFDVKITKDERFERPRWNPLTYGPLGDGVGYLTLVYKIEEGERYRIRNIDIEGNNEIASETMRRAFKMHEGEYFNARLLNIDVTNIKDRYGKLGRMYAKIDALPRFREEAGTVDIVYHIDEDRVYTIRRVDVHIRGDNPHTRETVVLNRILTHPGDLADPKLLDRGRRRLENQIFERGQNGPRVQIVRVDEEESPFATVRGQAPPPLPVEQPPNLIFENNNAGDVFDRALSQPPGQIDVNYFVTEARTGRLMFGVGVNSDAGVLGSIVLEENNFDILRTPESWRDFTNGTAWRGGGQRIRIEAIPGDIVSRYLLSWSDPYFLNTDYSLGVSAFYFNRFYPDWDEDRTGGRITLGKLLTKEWSVSGAIRLESIELYNPDVPTPALLTAALGENFLSSGRISVAYDTRDTPYLPAEGYFLQGSFEQAFGDFVFSRFEAEARQYWTVHSRPDGGGRHVVSLRGRLGFTGDDTPIFERYYAGGYQSFRGYEFRGVGPNQLGVRVGGRFMALGGVQYNMPITADETISAVAFSDFGTIENNAGFDDFRATFGVGLRLLIPAMGPAPIALDWAIPIVDAQGDKLQVFSFYVGLTR